jgi:phospholipase D1/2
MQKDSFGRLYSESAKKLRVDLYMEHFGFSKEVCEDFHDELVWKEIRINAKSNTEIYRTVFGCYPDDEMKTIQDVKDMIIDEPDREVYLAQTKHIKGHVVDFPLRFLEKENLNLKINQKEFFVPYINFT